MYISNSNLVISLSLSLSFLLYTLVVCLYNLKNHFLTNTQKNEPKRIIDEIKNIQRMLTFVVVPTLYMKANYVIIIIMLANIKRKDKHYIFALLLLLLFLL